MTALPFRDADAAELSRGGLAQVIGRKSYRTGSIGVITGVRPDDTYPGVVVEFGPNDSCLYGPTGLEPVTEKHPAYRALTDVMRARLEAIRRRLRDEDAAQDDEDRAFHAAVRGRRRDVPSDAEMDAALREQLAEDAVLLAESEAEQRADEDGDEQ